MKPYSELLQKTVCEMYLCGEMSEIEFKDIQENVPGYGFLSLNTARKI